MTNEWSCGWFSYRPAAGAHAAAQPSSGPLANFHPTLGLPSFPSDPSHVMLSSPHSLVIYVCPISLLSKLLPPHTSQLFLYQSTSPYLWFGSWTLYCGTSTCPRLTPEFKSVILIAVMALQGLHAASSQLDMGYPGQSYPLPGSELFDPHPWHPQFTQQVTLFARTPVSCFSPAFELWYHIAGKMVESLNYVHLYKMLCRSTLHKHRGNCCQSAMRQISQKKPLKNEKL